MFKHEKRLFHPIAIEKANPQYAALLQEQLGGANGELKAHNAMFREAFNRVQQSGSNRDFGTTKAARMYFNMSTPSPGNNVFSDTDTKPVSFK